MTKPPLFEVADLTVSYETQRGRLKALDAISFSINRGEAVALVGESGSGKSTIALATTGLLGPEASVSGTISFAGNDLSHLSAEERRKARGRNISVVFQDPFTSLNPSLPIGLQVAEPLMEHLGLSRDEAIKRASHALKEVGLSDVERIIPAYPHQLSGGMQQRVLIATALVCDPELIVLDEPTTALDVTVEARILDLLDEIRRKRDISMMFITHNLGVVNRIADRVCVIYAGRIVEAGIKDDVLGAPLHPYTKGLLASLPRLHERGRSQRLTPIGGRFPDLTALPPGCVFAPRCPFAEAKCNEPQLLRLIDQNHAARCWKAEALRNATLPKPEMPKVAEVAPATSGVFAARELSKTYFLSRRPAAFRWSKRFGLPWPARQRTALHAVDSVSFQIATGEVLGVVGESGSGKSTMARLAIRLIEADKGEITFDGQNVRQIGGRALKRFRKSVQIVFQNPDSSLNPRRTVGDAISRAVKLHTKVPVKQRRAHVENLMDRVGLPRNYYDRYPHQLSGGEKQRIGVARALATEPAVMVCDEPVSALDVSVQATVLNLLSDLRDQYNLAYLFISHDLSVVAHIADRVAVMYAGKIVETGTTDQVLQPPYHPYTEALLTAIPFPDPALAKRHPAARVDVGTERAATGCPFHPRCPRKLGAICETTTPPTVEAASGHTIVCHIPLPELERVPSALPAESAVA
jgi:peptide/nickel transport system ATP-binding protein